MEKQRKTSTPKLMVELPVETQKRSFALKAPTLRTLTHYAEFLSAHYGTAIDEDRVLEGLIAELAKDRAFVQWQTVSKPAAGG